MRNHAKNFFQFLSAPVVRLFEKAAVQFSVFRVLQRESYHVYSGCPAVARFEKQAAALLGVRRAIALHSGTDALITALRTLDIGPGNEVIVPAFSFISTASAVKWMHANPVFVDIVPEDYSIDPEKVKYAITAKTKAIILVHLFGQPALRTKAVKEIARARNLYLIEDAAQSFGASILVNGAWKMAGTLGDAGCFSFSPSKHLASPGNGGMVTFRNERHQKIAQKISFYGTESPYQSYQIIGINNRLEEIQAAALSVRLCFFDYWNSHRESIARIYSQELGGVGDILLPRENKTTKRVWYRYVIQTASRDKLFDFLAADSTTFFGKNRDKKAIPFYPKILPQFEIFHHSSMGDFPVATKIAQENLALPIGSAVSAKDALAICSRIKKFFGEPA